MEDESLVCISEERWLAPSECIWDAPFDLVGKVKLPERYRSLKSFFTTILGVDTVSPALLLEDWLNRLTKAESGLITDVDAKRIKDVMLFLVKLDGVTNIATKPGVVEKLNKIKTMPCLPTVKHTQTGKLLQMPTGVFFVDDHKRYSEILATNASSPVSYLDVDIYQYRTLESLWSMLGIRGCLLSQHVKEVTDIPKSMEFEANLTRDFNARAYYLAW